MSLTYNDAMKEKKFFRNMLICDGLLFALTCFSVIFCILNSSFVNDTQSSSHIMSIVYLVFHLVIEGVVFYYAFRGMVKGSTFIKPIMMNDNGTPNMKCCKNALIFFSISMCIFAYMCVIVFPVDIFLSFFALGLKFALLNFFALVAMVSIFFFCYTKIEEE